MEPLPQLAPGTVALLREGAQKCADCAAILKHVVGDNRLGPAWHADGSPFKVEDEKRHILELVGLAVPAATRTLLRERAGTCRKPDGRGCFYCARILDAITKEGLLREWPHDAKDEQVRIPVSSQIVHVMLEVGKAPVLEEAK